MPRSRLRRMTAVVTTVSFLSAATPIPVYASEAGHVIGGIIGGIIGGVIANQGRHQRGTTYQGRTTQSRKTQKDDAATTTKTNKNTDVALAALGSNDGFNAALNGVVVKALVPNQGKSEPDVIGLTRSDDGKRDIQTRTEEFIKDIIDGQPGGQVGDVNQVSVEQAIDDAYSEAKLEQFEEFQGENLTRDRLKVAIINNTKLDLAKLKTGNNLGLVRMSDLKRSINNAARVVFRQTFEMSELLAMNQRVVDFTLYVWEHSDSDSADYRPYSSADLVKASLATYRAAQKEDRQPNAQTDAKTKTPQKFDRQLLTAMEYRGARVAIDCFSHHVKSELTSTNDLAEKIETLAHGTCKDTVLDFLQSNDVTRPEARRAVWSVDRSSWTDVAYQATKSN